jgi:hypothetical protein
MTSPSFDLSEEFPGRGRPSEVGFRQGRVVSWNGFSFENQIDVGGQILDNLPLLNTLEGIGVRVGDVLSLVRIRSAYAILGRITNVETFDPTKSTMLARDFSGNIIFAPDVASEQGIGKPWLGIPMHNALFSAPTSTTSATFEPLFRGYMFKQHPKLRMRFTANIAAATTGEARMTVNGTVVGSVTSLPASSFANYTIGPEEIAGAHEQELIVELQGRRASGAGAVQFWCNGTTAEQS